MIYLSKPELPKEVGVWLDSCSYSGLFDAVADCVWDWLDEDYEGNVKKLHLAFAIGYTIEKEKLYTVQIPNPNSKGKNKFFLCKDPNTQKVYLCEGNSNRRKNKNLWLTKKEILADFKWAWEKGFAKEIE